MAATVEIDEINDAGLVVVDGLTVSGYAAVDDPNLTAILAALNPIDPALHSFEKWQRWHVVGMGGSREVRNLRFYSPVSPSTNTEHRFNGHEVQATYDASKKTAAAQPDRTTGDTPNLVPTTLPASANIGIAGQLVGALRDAGVSDYVVSQVRTNVSALVGAVLRNRYRYDDYAGVLFVLGVGVVMRAVGAPHGSALLLGMPV